MSRDNNGKSLHICSDHEYETITIRRTLQLHSKETNFVMNIIVAKPYTPTSISTIHSRDSHNKDVGRDCMNVYILRNTKAGEGEGEGND